MICVHDATTFPTTTRRTRSRVRSSRDPRRRSPLRNSIRRVSKPRTHSSRRQRARWRPRRGSTSRRPGNTAETLASLSSPRRASDETPSPGDRRRGRRARRVVVFRDSREVIHGREAAFASRRPRRRPGSRRGKRRRIRVPSRVTSGFVARARPHRRRGSVATEDDDSAGGVRKRRGKYRRHVVHAVGRPSIGGDLLLVGPNRVQPSVASTTIGALPARRRRRTGATPRAKTNARLSSRRSSAPGARSNARAPTSGFRIATNHGAAVAARADTKT